MHNNDMPVIKYAEALKSIMKKPVFVPEDLHNAGIQRNYAKKLLHILKKNLRIKRIERGKYTCLDDPIAVAAHITTPCYLSLWTAMSIRNLTTQVPFSVEVVTSRKRFKRKIIFSETPIVFYTTDPKMMFGYENVVWKENIRIAVAKPEKIVIDAVYFDAIPEDDVLDIIRAADISLLKKYAALTEKNTENRIKELIRKC